MNVTEPLCKTDVYVLKGGAIKAMPFRVFGVNGGYGHHRIEKECLIGRMVLGCH